MTNTKPEGHPGSWKVWSEDVQRWKRPVYYFEWLLERLDFAFQRWALLKVLNHVSKLSILVAVISYLLGSDARERDRIQRAWQTIYSAAGQGGDGGRKGALEFLVRRGELLEFVDLSKANLAGARLREVTLSYANLKETSLFGADLSSARLNEADFSGANLREAKFTDATLFGANLSNASLHYADLSGTNLCKGILIKAILRGADLGKAVLYKADLSGANLDGASLADADLRSTDLAAAEDLTLKQVLATKAWDEFTKFPADIEKALIERGEPERIPK